MMIFIISTLFKVLYNCVWFIERLVAFVTFLFRRTFWRPSIVDIFKPYDTFYLGGASWACGVYIGMFGAIFDRLRAEQTSETSKMSETSETSETSRSDSRRMTESTWDKLRLTRIGGHSAGALIAIMIVLGIDVDRIRETYQRLADQARIEGVWGGKMTQYHFDVLDEILSDENAYLICNRRLQVGLTITKPTWSDPNSAEFVIVERWTSNSDLRNCLLCSFHVPVYCTYDAKWTHNGTQHIALDGGMGYDKSLLPRRCLSIGFGDNYDVSVDIGLVDVVYPPTDEAALRRQLSIGYQRMSDFFAESEAKIRTKNSSNNVFLPNSVWYMLHRLCVCF